MTFTEKIEKLLASNYLKEVIDEFLNFLHEVPQSNKDARSDANQLRGQIIVLSGRFTDLNTKINTDTIDPASANQEKSALINSFINILNQLPSNYPDLNNYLEEKNEEDAWKESQRKNTIEAYHSYFNRYPNGKYKEATIKLISELEEVKAKQDSEIKRLALLEKERRVNDKVAGESQNVDAPATSRPEYNAAAVASTSPPAKSKKRLYIGLGAAVVAALVIFFLTKGSSENNDEPASTGEEQTYSAPGEATRAELIAAIRLANDAEINACSTLNTESLSQSYTDEALDSLRSKVKSLESRGLTMSLTIEGQEFPSLGVSPDELEAEVQVVQTRSSIYYTAETNECHGKVSAHEDPQTVYLKKSEGGWLITSIVKDNPGSPDLEACD